MAQETENKIPGNNGAADQEASLQAALYDPIDLNDRDNWPLVLLRRRWTILKELNYREKVQAAIVAGLPVPPRFDPEENPSAKKVQKGKFSIKETLERRQRFRASVAVDETPVTELATPEADGPDAEDGAEEQDDLSLTPEQEAEYEWLEEMWIMTHVVDARSN